MLYSPQRTNVRYRGDGSMDRRILHVDCNKFYASVECAQHPALRDKPLVVGGNEEARHGVVLTKNELAARYGIKTGETLWSARRKCPDLITVPPHFHLYNEYSDRVRHILLQYTPLVEPFGLDEAWMDITACRRDPIRIAQDIRCRIKEELGITVSIGVSFNKTFAKLGSDYKKPDTVTVFSRENYRQLVWPLPIGELLYVGNATKSKLEERFLYTIGDVANADPALLYAILGKGDTDLYAVANGWEHQPVVAPKDVDEVQSVSNGMTTPRDLTDNRDVKQVITALAESVGQRLRHRHLCGRTIELHLRDNRHPSHRRRGAGSLCLILPCLSLGTSATQRNGGYQHSGIRRHSLPIGDEQHRRKRETRTIGPHRRRPASTIRQRLHLPRHRHRRSGPNRFRPPKNTPIRENKRKNSLLFMQFDK